MSGRPKGPGLTYAVLCMVLLVVLATFALTQRTPPPPTIAEFAPQSQERITDSPDDQSSSIGRGAGDCAAGQACGAGDGGGGGQVTPTPPPIEVARVRKCIGDPPRQIEDAQSPPCVPYWAGDNGGETSKGVTRDEVRIAMPDEDDNLQALMQSFFNKRFEFYGRKIRLIKTTADNGDSSDAGQKAAAVAADEQHDVFASMNSDNGGGFAYYDELARRKIVFAIARGMVTEPYLSSLAPYGWQYQMSVDRLQQQFGEMTCKLLAGRPASHAGTPDLTAATRAFGIVTQSESVGNPVSDAPLESALKSCNAGKIVHSTYEGGDHGDADKAVNTVLRFKQQGVTSVYCFCHILGFRTIAAAASNQGYLPEWLVSDVININTPLIYALGPSQEHRRQMFGMSIQPMERAPDEHPVNWAQAEAGSPYLYSNANSQFFADYEYWSLLLLASGIQMAGPKLTPETFQTGLQRATFPNPTTPQNQGKVGFEGGSHTMTIDAAPWWWDNSARSAFPEESAGSFCYVGGAETRYQTGQWPTEALAYFEPPCIP